MIEILLTINATGALITSEILIAGYQGWGFPVATKKVVIAPLPNAKRLATGLVVRGPQR